MLTIAIVGEVDHGKSTLLGRLLIDLKNIASDKLDAARRLCDQRDLQFEPSFLLDAFEEEHDQRITIDTTRVQMTLEDKKVCFVDSPGHQQLVKNMISGASLAHCSLVVIDAKEGIKDQTKEHLRILKFLGVTNTIFVVNKMDEILYSQHLFEKLGLEIRSIASDVRLTVIAIVPVAALSGENVLNRSEEMPWYYGNCLVDLLRYYDISKQESNPSQPLRFLVQSHYKVQDKDYFLGIVAAGCLKVGDKVMILPAGIHDVIESIYQWPHDDIQTASEGTSTAVSLKGSTILTRGDVICSPECLPVIINNFKAEVVWLGVQDYNEKDNYIFKLGTASRLCTFKIKNMGCQLNSLKLNVKPGTICDVEITLDSSVVSDLRQNCPPLSNFVLCSPNLTLAAGAL